MGVKRLLKTDEFVAIDDIGNCMSTIEYTEIIGVDSQDGEHTETSGGKHYLTAANEKVEPDGATA